MRFKKRKELVWKSLSIVGIVVLCDGIVTFFAGVFAGWGCNYGDCLGWSGFLFLVSAVFFFVGFGIFLSTNLFSTRSTLKTGWRKPRVFGKGKYVGIAALVSGSAQISLTLLGIWYHRLPVLKFPSGYSFLFFLIGLGVVFVLAGLLVLHGSLKSAGRPS
ncbi:MAG: hypothetical protein ACE5IO_10795 [Thermoplasmata archaeon]